jgi:hypothetical protein
MTLLKGHIVKCPNVARFDLDSVWRVGCFLLLLWGLLPSFAFAQSPGAGGLAIQLFGMVQVEPGSNVITLSVKTQEIRFVLHDVHGPNRDFSLARFFSDIKSRQSGLYVKGPDLLLDILIREKPNKRVLKLTGLYYSESRTLVLNDLNQVQEQSERRF